MKFKRDADEVGRIMTELVAQKDATWAQLTKVSRELEREKSRYENLERERDEFSQRYAAMTRDRDYWREQAGGNEL